MQSTCVGWEKKVTITAILDDNKKRNSDGGNTNYSAHAACMV